MAFHYLHESSVKRVGHFFSVVRASGYLERREEEDTKKENPPEGI